MFEKKGPNINRGDHKYIEHTETTVAVCIGVLCILQEDLNSCKTSKD